MDQATALVSKFGQCKAAGVYFIIALIIALVAFVYGLYIGTGFAFIGLLINVFWIIVITAVTWAIANYAPTQYACGLAWLFVFLVVLFGLAMNLGYIIVPAKYWPTQY